MKSISKMTRAELAAYVQSHLQAKGITVILSGGASVAISTSNKYVSADVDLVDVYSVERNRIMAAMEEIGFHEKINISFIRIRNTLSNFQSIHFR